MSVVAPVALRASTARSAVTAAPWFGGAVVLGFAIVDAGLQYQHHDWWVSWFGVLSCVCFAATWAVLRLDPVQRPNSRPCLAAAVIIVLSNDGVGYFGPSWVVFSLTQTLVAVPISILLLRYPYPRIPRRLDRWFVVVLAVWLQLSAYASILTWTPEAATHEWWPTLVHGNHLQAAVGRTADIGEMLLAGIGLVLVVRRTWSARGPDRRELVPVTMAGAIYALASLGVVIRWAFIASPGLLWMDHLGEIVQPVVPLAFLGVAIERRLARARVADLATSIGTSVQPGTGPTGLLSQLRRALDDPQLDIRYWIEDRWVDSEGAEAGPPPSDRMIVPISSRDGTPLAQLIADPILARHRDLLDAAVAPAALALENARLHTALLAQLAQLTSAQQRIVEAGLTERRRIERDLHDGAQQRLLAASMTLARAQDAPDDSRELITAARGQLREALAELRDLARGIHPAILSQSGVAAATLSLVEHSPVPVTLDVPDRRWAPAVESTAYFVIAEGLANAAKHAPDARVAVRVREMGETLIISVRDDGPGTVDPHGSGLTGLADRVRAIGGRLVVNAVPGRGSELEALIPCG